LVYFKHMNPENLEQEIKDLQEKLDAKKKEVIDSDNETPDEEIFKSVIREHASDTEAPQPTLPTTRSDDDRELTKDEKQKINELIAHSFIRGVKSAVKEARKTKDAFFIDYLHDKLATEYYKRLVLNKKVKSN